MASRYGVPMRWDALFDDLAAQLAAAQSQDRVAAVADLTRAEHATVSLAERLRAAPGVVTLDLRDASAVTGEVREVAQEWTLLADGRRQHLVPLDAVVAVRGLGRHADPPRSFRSATLGLGHALRALQRDRRPVQVRTAAGSCSVGSPAWGRIISTSSRRPVARTARGWSRGRPSCASARRRRGTCRGEHAAGGAGGARTPSHDGAGTRHGAAEARRRAVSRRSRPPRCAGASARTCAGCTPRAR